MMSRNAETLKRLRAEAIARGDCYACRCRPVRPSTRYCEECHARSNAGKKRQYAKRRKERLCTSCGEKAARGYRLCGVHLAQERVDDMRRLQRLADAGLCIRCEKAPRDAGRAMCTACLVDNSERAGRYKRSRIAAGFCSYGGCHAPLATGWYCVGHASALRIANVARKTA